jgi:tetratricopeptide (TPR) repeat protein
LGEYSLAEPFLEKAVRLNKQDLNALASYGYTLHKLAKSNDAIKYMNQALLLDPVNVNIMSTLGLIFDELEMWTECDSIYLAALVVDSANALIKNNYAYSLSKRAVELPRALRMVTEALEKEPANSSYLDTKGWVYYQMGEFRNAKDFIERSLAINGDNAVVLDHLGDVFDKMGDNKKAIETWRKAVELKPADAAIKAKIERRTK